MNNYLFVFFGGGLGAAFRYWLTGFVQKNISSVFPLGTLVVNVVGCFAIGFLMMIFEERFLVNPSLRIFLTIGILGGFTTFSSFGYETISLLRDGELAFAAINIFASVAVCLLSAYVGTLLGKLL